MDRPEGRLPGQFADLQSLCDRWDLPDFSSRFDRRRMMHLEALAEDHLTMVDRGPEILAYLDARPLGAFAEEDARLARMMLALPVISMAVEVLGDPAITDADGLIMRVTAEPGV